MDEFKAKLNNFLFIEVITYSNVNNSENKINSSNRLKGSFVLVLAPFIANMQFCQVGLQIYSSNDKLRSLAFKVDICSKVLGGVISVDRDK